MKKNNRLVVLSIFAAAVFIFLVGRLVYVMVFDKEEIYDKALGQIVREVAIPAARGDILDRNYNLIAASAEAYRLDIDLKTFRRTLEEKGRTAAYYAAPLSGLLGETQEEILKVLEKDANGSLVKRKLEKSQADALRVWMKAEETNFLILGYDSIRYYPNMDYLSHVLGSVGSDGQGTMGIEYTYDKELTGMDGIRIAEIDGKKQELPYTEVIKTEAVDGSDLVLTIDERIQYLIEGVAEKAMKDNEAKSVTIIVSDPRSGEIYGLVNLPDFDPNAPAKDRTQEEFDKVTRNLAVNDTYEPGSTFKIVTMAAALSENEVDHSFGYFCKGFTHINGVKIRCSKPEGHGQQNLLDIIRNSCNPGIIEIGQRLGQAKLNEYIEKFNFGSKTGIDLPGEAKGIIKSTDTMTFLDLATISMGQTDTATPIQILGALNIIANGGFENTLHLKKEAIPKNGKNEKLEAVPYVDQNMEKVIDADVNADILKMLEAVVERGSAQSAFVEGLRIFGKTGTAQKIDPATGTYSSEDFIASFVGAAPANDPKVSIFVSIDSPRGSIFGGVVAAPLAKEIFLEIQKYIPLVD